MQVKSGQNQAQWEKSGWITAQDPRGWFQWYCRFYQVGLPASDYLPCLAWGCCVLQHSVCSLVSAVMVLLSIRCHRWDFMATSRLFQTSNNRSADQLLGGLKYAEGGCSQQLTTGSGGQSAGVVNKQAAVLGSLVQGLSTHILALGYTAVAKKVFLCRVSAPM